ncbi:MAG TPA: ROK family protein [Candidatus Polarisedimenticolia bacterium]|nr:ROK family protein [Candidatus Polarisedimenticolia bacterium]
MNPPRNIFIGTDSGATTSKIAGVWGNGEAITTKLLQRPTNAQNGTDAVIASWISAIGEFLAENKLAWAQVEGVGLAIPGPYQRYGVLDLSANLPASFKGWDVYTAYSRALALQAGRELPLVVGNDGKCGGVAEARLARGDAKASVLMLMPGSGLGSAFVAANGLPLEGDTLAGMETAHMPAPLHLLGMTGKPFPCGCGRDWGCIEAYTTISGLARLLDTKLVKYPGHELAKSTATAKEKALSLRGRAQKDDPLAVEIFDFQAQALGLHVANLTLALDPSIVIIGGGLMDPEATSTEFRERYLGIIKKTAMNYIWPSQRGGLRIVPAALGDLSQAIGAALLALYQAGRDF